MQGEEAEKERCSCTEAQSGSYKGPKHGASPKWPLTTVWGVIPEISENYWHFWEEFLCCGDWPTLTMVLFPNPEIAREASLPWVCRPPGGSVQPGRDHHSVIKLPWGLHQCPHGPGGRCVHVGTHWPHLGCPFVLVSNAQGPSLDVHLGMFFHNCYRENLGRSKGRAAGISVTALELCGSVFP